MKYYEHRYEYPKAHHTPCKANIKIEEAIKIARQHIGEVYSAKSEFNKRSNKCYYVKCESGSVIVDSESGKVIRF